MDELSLLAVADIVELHVDPRGTIESGQHFYNPPSRLGIHASENLINP